MPPLSFAVATLVGSAPMFIGCNQTIWPDRSSPVTDSTLVDNASFWPASIHYIAIGETAVVELRGLQRGFVSSTILQCSLRFRDSSGDSATLQPYARIKFPANPETALDLTGLDTALKQVVSLPAGSWLFLQSTNAARTDTAQIVSASVHSDTITCVPDTSGKVVKGRFTFQDSTAAHPLRTVRSDSLPPCETLQGAVFTRHADTLQVRFHRLLLNALLHDSLPPCAGPHPDSIEVVGDRFGFPGL